MSLIDRHQSQLLLVDIQEKFLKAIPDMQGAVQRASILAKAAKRVAVPVVASEQYPKALGETVPQLKSELGESPDVFDKLCFSAGSCRPLADRMNQNARSQILVCGVEAHVCVLQTVFELLNGKGFTVFVLADAVASRKPTDKELALRRMERQGAHIVSTEMVVFEWLRSAEAAEFKELQKLIL